MHTRTHLLVQIHVLRALRLVRLQRLLQRCDLRCQGLQLLLLALLLCSPARQGGTRAEGGGRWAGDEGEGGGRGCGRSKQWRMVTTRGYRSFRANGGYQLVLLRLGSSQACTQLILPTPPL